MTDVLKELEQREQALAACGEVSEEARALASEVIAPPSVDKLVEVYINLRDRRAARTSAYEKEDKVDKEKMEVVEAELLRRAEDEGVNGFKTDHGTTYIDVKYLCSGADWGAFYNWMKENDAIDMLERRIKGTSIKEYMEEHEGAIPPGVNVVSVRQMKVRRN